MTGPKHCGRCSLPCGGDERMLTRALARIGRLHEDEWVCSRCLRELRDELDGASLDAEVSR